MLVVSMPITSVNRSLLPDHVFALYKNNLRVVSKLFGARYLDLDEMKCFNDQDFGDTVHLNTFGSNKMIKLISDYVIANNLNRAVVNQQKSLAENGMGL